MANDSTKAILARIDAALVAIEARITALETGAAGGMTAAEVSEVNTALDGEATKLEALGTPTPPTA